MLCSSHRKEQREGQGGDHSHTQASELTSREGGGELETQSRSRMMGAHIQTTVSWNNRHDYCGQHTQNRQDQPGILQHRKGQSIRHKHYAIDQGSPTF